MRPAHVMISARRKRPGLKPKKLAEHVAQVKCPEGKSWNGDCVNPGLAAAIRQTAIIFSQPKLSSTAYPVLPVDDLLYRYPHQLIPDPLKLTPAFTGSP